MFERSTVPIIREFVMLICEFTINSLSLFFCNFALLMSRLPLIVTLLYSTGTPFAIWVRISLAANSFSCIIGTEPMVTPINRIASNTNIKIDFILIRSPDGSVS
jgi:hypothetical protein